MLSVLWLMPHETAAVSLSASPTTATVGQQVHFTAVSTFRQIAVSVAISTSCTMQVNYGDGSGWGNLGSSCAVPPDSCTRSSSHSYNAAGIYNAQIRPAPGSAGCRLLISPTTDTVRVVVNAAPATTVPGSTTTAIISKTVVQHVTLPDGIVGMAYEYALGSSRATYRRISGRLAAGLKINRHLLQGVPERQGTYRFNVKATDSRGTVTETAYVLKVVKARLRVMATPQKITLDRNRSGSFNLTYHLTSTERISDTISSARGLFLAGSRTLGTINTRISTSMTRGAGQLNERVVVPLRIIQTARRLGLDRIQYQRTFTARYMDAATTSSTAIAVGTGFTFTHIRLLFDDHTSKKFVKRNEKIGGARVELRYEGAGLLKGYWQVDDRILARVTRNLPFANTRTLTLQLPKVPRLPTYSMGSHRLRFVITNPPMHIAFPQVIYVVTGEDLAISHPIHLLSPIKGATTDTGSLQFFWKPRHEVALYKLEILAGKGEKQKTVFSAFSKKAFYTLPERAGMKKLIQGEQYSWRITGLDRNNKPIARSRDEAFRLGAKPLSYVPGRLLMLVAVRPGLDINKLVTTLTAKYPLTLEGRKPLQQLGRELVTFSITSGNVKQLGRAIAAEQQGVLVQPDYLYSTLGAISEQANRSSLFQFLRLKATSTGKGVRVAIIDTGVDLHHDDLSPNIVAHANFIKDSPYRAEIHGTAVAGIIGATVNGTGSAGIAPESSLIALRGCEQVRPDKAEGRCYSSSIIQAINAAMANKARFINMSLGTNAPDHLVASGLDTATDAGIVILAPAGNDPHQTDLAFPASHPKVISVAGALDNGRKMPNDRVAARADCILPAQYVPVTLPGNRVSFMNGTSMASAEAAGLLADLNPDTEKITACRKTPRLLACLGK